MIQYKLSLRSFLPTLYVSVTTTGLLAVPVSVYADLHTAEPAILQPLAEQEFAQLAAFNSSDYEWIGARIYQNECNSNPRYLTHWGEGEAFPSFGIGHFIWFPEGVSPPFEQTFPRLLSFMASKQELPSFMLSWAKTTAPWQDKTQFEASLNQPNLQKLRDFLEHQQGLQAEFIVQEFMTRWQQQAEQASVSQRIQRDSWLKTLLQFRSTTFALIDYTNFKGMGSNAREQYQGVGWGLTEVLDEMSSEHISCQSEQACLSQFIQAGKNVLQGRVNVAPPERNELRWLKGWFKRLDDYRLNSI